MQLFSRRRKQAENGREVGVGVVIISAACCVAGMKPFDDQARRVVDQAITETGVEAHVEVVSAVSAFFGGGALRQVMAKLISDAQSGQVGVPVIMVNGKAVSYGVPRLEDLKTALLEVVSSQAAQGGEER